MDSNINVFIELLYEEIRKQFPHTKVVLVSGGDFIKDLVFELRQENLTYRYKPYELFTELEINPEEEIINICEEWEITLKSAKLQV